MTLMVASIPCTGIFVLLPAKSQQPKDKPCFPFKSLESIYQVTPNIYSNDSLQFY